MKKTRVKKENACRTVFRSLIRKNRTLALEKIERKVTEARGAFP